ncbi:MAG: DUF5702 domain-containing protein [Lachnospiraceae bacterium]
MKKAEITVYLALTLSVMLSLILTLVEGARSSAIRMQIECVTDMGLNSIFAEYNKELLRQYELMFIDTSYGRDLATLANTETHLRNYMEYNFNPTKQTMLLDCRDWLGIQIEDVMILEASLATDESGGICKRQAIRYQKNRFGLTPLQDITKDAATIKQQHWDTGDITQEQDRNHDMIDAALPMRENEKGEMSKVTIDNPADQVLGSRNAGILNLVLDNPSEVSHNSALLSAYSSHRVLHTGTGIPENHSLEEGLLEEGLFGEYLLDQCSTYRKPLEKSLLKYQIEYILFGCAEDSENLQCCANRLLLIRGAANLAYLRSDSTKMAEADMMALAIASAVLLPELQQAIKQSLVLAWAYAESVQDIKILLEGGLVPLQKGSADWHTQLSHLKDFRSHLQENNTGVTGLDYNGYLRILLSLMDRKEKTSRFLDIIEMDLRLTEGNKEFKIDACLDSLTADIALTSTFGYQYQIHRFYCYE